MLDTYEYPTDRLKREKEQQEERARRKRCKS